MGVWFCWYLIVYCLGVIFLLVFHCILHRFYRVVGIWLCTALVLLCCWYLLAYCWICIVLLMFGCGLHGVIAVLKLGCVLHAFYRVVDT